MHDETRSPGRPEVRAPEKAVRPATLSEAFSGRRNSIAFLRWLFAIAVVVDHTYSTGGFNRAQGPISHWTVGQATLGDLAVVGFFILSGYLVTRSRDRMDSGGRYMWHRFLRIFPGFWVCLIVTAFILAPIEWQFETNKGVSALFALHDGPLQYVRKDFFLTMHQWVIGPLLSGTPMAHRGNLPVWDGSLWTLIYEFRCYIVVAVVCLALSQTIRRRAFVVLTVGAALIMAVIKIDPNAEFFKFIPFVEPFAFIKFTFCFLLGALAYYYGEYIPIRREAFVGAAIVFLYTLHSGGLYFIGFVAFAYCLMCAVVLLPIYRWDRFGDLSYGIYIYAFPAQQMLAAHNFQKYGPIPFMLVSIVLCSIAAYGSWHLVEKWALRLKGIAWPRRLSLAPAGAHRSAPIARRSTADEG